jgi:hypothetical protein
MEESLDIHREFDQIRDFSRFQTTAFAPRQERLKRDLRMPWSAEQALLWKPSGGPMANLQAPRRACDYDGGAERGWVLAPC